MNASKTESGVRFLFIQFIRRMKTGIVLFFCLLGIFLFNGCAVDVLSVSPQSAAPGTIIKIEISKPHNRVEYKVMFGEATVAPLGMDDGFVTVMVPALDPGSYMLSMVPVKSNKKGDSIDFMVEEPPRVNGNEASMFFSDMKILVEYAEDYAEVLVNSPMYSSAINVDSLHSDFQKCIDFMSICQVRLNSLSEEDKILLSQMLLSSQLGNKVALTAKWFQEDKDLYYHQYLAEKDINEITDALIFNIMARLDVTSALLTDARVLIKAIKYGSLVGVLFGPGGQVVTAGIWSTLTPLDIPLKAIDTILDACLVTDLKSIESSLEPDQGEVLNPGETATLHVYGVFGPQKTLTEELISWGVDGILDEYDTETRNFLRNLSGISADFRHTLEREVADMIAGDLAEIGVEQGGDLLDSVTDFFNLMSVSVPYLRDVEINPEYYRLAPGQRFSMESVFPGVGAMLVEALDSAMQALLGGDELFLTNSSVTIDNESIAEYQPHSQQILAKSSGSTVLHVNPYRYCEVELPRWLRWADLVIPPIEGWVYLDEDEDIFLQNSIGGGGDTIAMNTPFKLVVSDANDPVISDLISSPVSGTVPGVFTTDGGSFEISVSPIDANGNLLYDDLYVDDFSFSPISVSNLSNPKLVVASGWAVPDWIERIMPGNPGLGINVAILLDSSGSMSSNDPSRQRVDAAKSLINVLSATDNAAILDFGAGNSGGFYETRLLQDFTSDHGLLHDAIDQVTDSGGTPMYTSIDETLVYMGSQNLSNLVLVVLTDGRAGDDGYFDEAVAQSQGLGIPIFTVGLGDSLDFTQLQALAAQTGGTFSSASDSSTLQNLFESVGVAVSAGRIIVHASGAFIPVLQDTGEYVLHGELKTKISGLTIPTPFEFVVDVLSVEDGRMLKGATN